MLNDAAPLISIQEKKLVNFKLLFRTAHTHTHVLSVGGTGDAACSELNFKYWRATACKPLSPCEPNLYVDLWLHSTLDNFPLLIRASHPYESMNNRPGKYSCDYVYNGNCWLYNFVFIWQKTDLQPRFCMEPIGVDSKLLHRDYNGGRLSVFEFWCYRHLRARNCMSYGICPTNRFRTQSTTSCLHWHPTGFHHAIPCRISTGKHWWSHAWYFLTRRPLCQHWTWCYSTWLHRFDSVKRTQSFWPIHLRHSVHQLYCHQWDWHFAISGCNSMVRRVAKQLVHSIPWRTWSHPIRRWSTMLNLSCSRIRKHGHRRSSTGHSLLSIQFPIFEFKQKWQTQIKEDKQKPLPEQADASRWKRNGLDRVFDTQSATKNRHKKLRFIMPTESFTILELFFFKQTVRVDWEKSEFSRSIFASIYTRMSSNHMRIVCQVLCSEHLNLKKSKQPFNRQHL